MTARIVFPRRSGEAGLWLSKPGVDVLTATADSDFLIRPSAKNEQIVQKGNFSIANGGAEHTIYFPEVLPQIPTVAFWPSYYSDRIQFPCRLQYVKNIQCWATTGGALFKNFGDALMWVYYIVIARTAVFG